MSATKELCEKVLANESPVEPCPLCKDWLHLCMNCLSEKIEPKRRLAAKDATLLAKMLLKAIEIHPEIEATLNEVDNG